MSAQHTQGRVKVQHPDAGERGLEVAFEPGLERLCADITEANARRLVACWNACEGISTDALERLGTLDRARVDLDVIRAQAIAQRDELLALLRIVRGKHACGALTLPPADLDRIDAAIAKTTGGTA